MNIARNCEQGKIEPDYGNLFLVIPQLMEIIQQWKWEVYLKKNDGNFIYTYIYIS